MNANHTPGPWHVGINPGPFIYGPNGEQVADLRAELLPGGERDANRRLIASAPHLLDTLKAIEHQANLTARTFPNAPGHGDWLRVQRFVASAIAKAEGQT